MHWQGVVAVGVLIGLAGCSTYRPAPVVAKPFPGPVAESPARAPSAPDTTQASVVAPTVEFPAAKSLPAQPPRQLADGSKVPAVQGLLATAERERKAGRLESAVTTLERAQRLAPQSWLIYQRLADIRLQQKRPAEAEQLARKGLGFAGGAAAQASLWRLIAEARRQQGREQAAQEAAARATAIESHAAEPL